jgi:alkylation response protein AidB-like acyl-CoA dehydrogenase
MQLDLSNEQELLRETFGRMFRDKYSLERVRAAEKTGIDADLWSALVESGAHVMRVPSEAGGSDSSLFDAVLVAEQAGRYLAHVPLVETIAAARLLSHLQSDGARSWLDRVIRSGSALSLALPQASLVPSGAGCDGVIFCEADVVKLRATPRRTTLSNFGELALTDLNAGGEDLVLATGNTAVAAYLTAVEEWKLLTAAVLVGLGRKAVENAAEYAKERHAFGKPIGAFQGVSHALSDALVDVESARLLLWKSVSLIADGQPEASASVAMAYWWAGRAAGAAGLRGMRIFGGYGMSLEQDAPFYYRRARALALVAGDPNELLLCVAERLWDGVSVPWLPAAGDIGIDFDFGPAAEALAHETDSFFTEHFTAEQRRYFLHVSEDSYDPALQVKLAQAGLLYPHWPKALRGRELDHYAVAASRRAAAEHGWHDVVPICSDMIAQIVMQFASAEAKAEILPKVANGDTNCSIGLSEPSAGSDVFAAKTRATRDGDDWIIDGQKMFTTQGHLADYAFVLARTDPNLPKHAGLTCFIVPLGLPGYSSQRVSTIGRERTNITFYSEMRVPDRYRLGDVNGGSKVLAAQLMIEQNAGEHYVGSLSRLLKHTHAWAASTPYRGQTRMQHRGLRLVMAKLAVAVQAIDALSRRALWCGVTGKRDRTSGPIAKLYGSETWLRLANELMDAAAPDALLTQPADLGMIELEARKAIPSTIYGGTSEVQRSIIAELALGLPRSR